MDFFKATEDQIGTDNSTGAAGNTVIGTARGMVGFKLPTLGTLKRLKWDWRRIDQISRFGGRD